jgi:hypothetical protein
MKLTRVQEAIKVLKASVDDAPVAKKATAKKDVRAIKIKKVVKAKN